MKQNIKGERPEPLASDWHGRRLFEHAQG